MTETLAAVSSRAVRVTLFEDRAEVVRLATLFHPGGTQWFAVGDVSALVYDPSVVVTVPLAPEVAVQGVRVYRTVLEERSASAQTRRAAELEMEKAIQTVFDTERSLVRSHSHLLNLLSLLESWTQSVGRSPRGGSDIVEQWEQAYRHLDETYAQVLARHYGDKMLLNQQHRDEAAARARFQEVSALIKRHVTQVQVQLQCPQARELEVELTYRLPCALWRPEHAAFLHTNGDTSELKIRTMATVWQATGETWEGVKCILSTARPARSSTPPLLQEDVLALRPKTDQEKREVIIEAREQEFTTAGMERGARTVEDMPGVDDGGEPLSFEVHRPATLASDGRPVRLDIADITLPAEFDRVGYAELSEAAFLRATATLTGSLPLLAGPVRLHRNNALLGRGRIEFVAPGEPFELGFGVDDGLRLRRTVEVSKDTVPLLGTQKVTVKVWVGVSNLSGVERTLTAVERYPVSEIADVKITLLNSAGATLDDREGLARFKLTIPPRETREVRLEYRVEAGGKVQLPF